MSWEPASEAWVAQLLGEDFALLHPEHKELLRPHFVNHYRVPVDDHPGKTVVVVAHYEGALLYYSDVEEGWELDPPTASGGIASRGCSQFGLGHIAHQVFGNPKA